jgi:hypothetical protein
MLSAPCRAPSPDAPVTKTAAWCSPLHVHHLFMLQNSCGVWMLSALPGELNTRSTAFPCLPVCRTLMEVRSIPKPSHLCIQLA